MECRKQKAREWQVRLQEDIKEHKNGKFITLTFSNEEYRKIVQNPGNIKALEIVQKLEGFQRDNQIATIAVRLFLERYRKKYRKSLRHFLVTELGHNGTENIHMHGIIWTDISLDEIEKIWSYGFMWKGKIVKGRLENYVSAKTVNYIIKYITKREEIYKSYKSIILTSPGIGKNYMKNSDHKQNKFNGEKTVETYRTNTGHKIAMPIYWRNKIYTDDEREKLWMQRLDKQIRYVNGEKIDISKDEKAYYEILKWHQERNKKLGYGDGQKDWEREKYEIERRNLKNAERLENQKKQAKKDTFFEEQEQKIKKKNNKK